MGPNMSCEVCSHPDYLTLVIETQGRAKGGSEEMGSICQL